MISQNQLILSSLSGFGFKVILAIGQVLAGAVVTERIALTLMSRLGIDFDRPSALDTPDGERVGIERNRPRFIVFLSPTEDVLPELGVGHR
jgi:hypothetical protein